MRTKPQVKPWQRTPASAARRGTRAFGAGFTRKLDQGPADVAQPKLRETVVVPASTQTPVPRDRRVPLAEIDDLLVKTIHVLGDTPLTRMEIGRRGGASASTLANWQNQRVRRPLVSTLNATLKACGYKLAIIDRNGEELK